MIILQKRCEWRGIDVEIKKIFVETNPKELQDVDLIFMGGAQDTQQEIVNRDLFEKKGKILKDLIQEGTPGLYICGAYQFLGKYYKTADGKKLPGLEVFPVYTENPGQKAQRLIGNIIVKANGQWLIANSNNTINHKLSTISSIVGFENHGGRTYLDDPTLAFAQVIKGFGNSGEDKTEGILYQNSIGTYLHGPILPKNPEIADFLIKQALKRKYKTEIELEVLDDSLATKAREIIINRK